VAGAVTVAICSVALLGETAYQFERTRVPLPVPAMGPADISASVALPRTIPPENMMVVIDLLANASVVRELDVAFGTHAPKRVTLRAGRPMRIHLAAPADVDVADLSPIRVSSSEGGWRILHAELTNFRGFSTGPLSAVIVPARLSDFDRPPPWYLLLFAIALTVAGLCRPWRSRLGLGLYGVLAVMVVALLGAIWAAPRLSPYRVLLAPHTWLLAMGILYLPAAERVLAPLVRRAALAYRRTVTDVRDALAAAPRATSLAANGDLVVAYAIGLAACAAVSGPRLVGDGAEYLAMASVFQSLRWPPIELSDHFWLYPALASPLIALADIARVGPLWGFFLLNLLLLVSAFAATLSRFGRQPALLLFIGPVLWWVDKVHPEALMFSMLAMAVAFLRDTPWWSFVTFGVAAAQNPAVAPLVPIAAMAAIAGRTVTWTDKRFWVGLGIGAALTALHPLYFVAGGARPVPLLPFGRLAWPSASKYMAVLLDSNVGLVYACPGLGLAMLLTVWSRGRRWRPTPDEFFAAAAAIVLLFAFAQTTNVNHGGTRDVSRYAIWLMPFAAPSLVVRTMRPELRRAMVLLCCASAVWSVAWFHPTWPERFLQPTRAAIILWTRVPSWTRPLPEVFVERLQGSEGFWRLAIAMPGCEKVLLVGRDGGPPEWPRGCTASAVPEPCDRSGVLCYANHRRDGYVFDVLKER
jgi:hypothetical protein